MKKKNSKIPKNRATGEEKENRHWDIDSLMDKGVKSSDIMRVLCQKYGISRRQAERDIQLVREKRCTPLTAKRLQELRSENVHILKFILKDSLQKGDYPIALKALEIQEDLIDKYPTTGGKHHDDVSDISKPVPQDLEQIFGRIKEDEPDPES
jgi:hypothetical protein